MLIFLFTSQFRFMPVQRNSAAHWANCTNCTLLHEIFFVQIFNSFYNVAKVILAAVIKFFNWKEKTQFHVFIFMFVIALYIQFASCKSNKHTESSLLPPTICSFVHARKNFSSLLLEFWKCIYFLPTNIHVTRYWPKHTSKLQ
jgi:hypothetical protein